MAEEQHITSSVFADSKPHYRLLDGLRGVAALLVLWYHVHEGFAFASGAPVITGINHGYLAVDFFFILSGFVIGYAYDDRWGKGMKLGTFFRRRLVRLHPMLVLGAVLGAVSFLLQGSVKWDGTHVLTSSVMLALLCAMFFIPAFPGSCYDVRGNAEAFPLNGPSWSLFFEYIGNILYALFLRRLKTKALSVLVVVLGAGFFVMTCFDLHGYGCLSVGWSMADSGFWFGLLRMLFPFSTGMLLSRKFRPVKIKGAFWLCSAILLALFIVPFVSSDGVFSLNGLYESFCVIAVFPLLVWLGASGTVDDGFSSGVCRFLGDISYPLYITHYPTMYFFYAWMMKSGRFTLADTWPVVIAVFVWCILVAYASLKLYDEPVRRWLGKKATSLLSLRHSGGKVQE